MLPLASSILFGLPLETIDTSEVISQPSRAQVLVIVSDSGSGTTDFGDALNKHPCMFNLGEPFMQSAMMWSKSEIAGCVYPDALFDADSGLLKHNNNTQLTRKIGQLRSSKARQAWQETGKRPDENLAGDALVLDDAPKVAEMVLDAVIDAVLVTDAVALPDTVRVVHGNGKEYERWGLGGLDDAGLQGVVRGTLPPCHQSCAAFSGWQPACAACRPPSCPPTRWRANLRH